MLVKVHVDHHGWMHIDPVSAPIRREVERYLEGEDKPLRSAEAAIFIQDDWRQEEFIRDVNMTYDKQREMARGYKARVRVNHATFWHYVAVYNEVSLPWE